MPDNVFTTLSELAAAAELVAPRGDVRDALAVIGSALRAGALVVAQDRDPVAHITRILQDDELIAAARAEREAALLAKFADDDP